MESERGLDPSHRSLGTTLSWAVAGHVASSVSVRERVGSVPHAKVFMTPPVSSGEPARSVLLVRGLWAGLIFVLAIALSAPTEAEGWKGLVLDDTANFLETVIRALGRVPDRVAITTLSPDPTTRTATWEDFSSALLGTTLERAATYRLGAYDGPVPPCRLGNLAGAWCGPDAGTGYPDTNLACDDSSAWVVYRGAPLGSAYTEKSPGSGSVTGTVCGSFWGPTVYWAALELSPTKVQPVLEGLIYEGGYSNHWALHASGYIPNSWPIEGGGLPSQGALDSFVLHWRFRGPGQAVSIDFGNEVVADLLLGGIGRLHDVDGATCYDLPPGQAFMGFLCP